MKAALILTALLPLMTVQAGDATISSSAIIDVPSLRFQGDPGVREISTITTTYPHQEWRVHTGREAKYQEFNDDPQSIVSVGLGVCLSVTDLEIKNDFAHIKGELTVTDVIDSAIADTVRGSQEPVLLKKSDFVEKKVPFSGSFPVSRPFLVKYSWGKSENLQARIVVGRAVEPTRPVKQK